jgi:hypothetical protein
VKGGDGMSSVLDDINKRRTRQSVGEQQPTAPVEPVAPAAQTMDDQAAARVSQGENGNVKTENGLNPTAEQKATAMMLVNPALTTPAQPEAPKQMTYTELHKELYKPMTPEEKAAQQKRQRNRQIINAVGDGISALANLYYTNKSGVNAYDPSTSLTKAAKERYDKLLAQQREDEEKYKEMAYRSGAADIEMAYRRAKDAKEQANADRTYNLALTQFRHKKDLEDAKTARDNALAELDIQLKIGKITEQEYRNQKAEIEAQYADGVQRSIIYRNNAAGANSDRGNRGEYVAYDKDGTPHYFKSKDAADQHAMREGTYVSVYEDQHTTSEIPHPWAPNETIERTTTTKKKVGGYSKKPNKYDKYKIK